MTSFPPPDSGSEYSGPPSLQKPPAPGETYGQQQGGYPTQQQPSYGAPTGQPYGAPTGQPYGTPPAQPYGTPPAQQYGNPYGGGPGYPPPAYGYPAGYPVNSGPGQNGLGLAGMITGIVGLVLCWIPFFGGLVALVGAILSGIAIPQAKSKQQGIGMAIAGLACGVVGVVIAVLIVVAIFVSAANDPYYDY